MDQPISAGCRAEVIDGLRGKDSPNLGLVVKVVERTGEHSLYGPIWLCVAEFAVVAQAGTRDRPPGTAHFAQSWLRRLPDPTTPLAAVTTKEEIPTC